MQRRAFLKLIGGGIVLGAAGATAFATTRTPAKAIAPWAAAGGYQDPRLRALSYAVLAPNPHNRQPWKVALDNEDRVTLYFDTERQLPETDPFDRQLTIGLGCFLELLIMAAAADGYRLETDLFSQGFEASGLDTRPVAHIRFTPESAEPDPLWQHVMARRSNKEPFDTNRPVSTVQLAPVLASARQTELGGSVAPDDIAYWRNLTNEALRIEVVTPHTFQESVDLMRIGKREINANPDGIDLGGPLFDSLAAVGLLDREAVADPSTPAYRQGLAAVLENADTAMGHVWMVTKGNSRLDQIAAGADWLRVNLACTAQGLGFQPLSQALQEYPEMAEIYAETHARLAPSGGTVQMLARIGYGPAVAASPRWPVEAKLVAS